MTLYSQPLGAHLSISGGFVNAIDDAQSIGCTALQFFLHSNRQWSVKDLSPERSEQFKHAASQSSITSFIAHASYLINLGSPSTTIRAQSLSMLKKELEQCHQLGVPFLVMHPGSATQSSFDVSIPLISDGINQVIQQTPGAVSILLENMAGQGSTIGASLEQLRDLYQGITDKKRIGFCFDTCHAFAAGYDYTTPYAYRSFWEHFDSTLGIQNLKAFHLNGSKKELGSRVDRHDHIDQGKIGLEAFRLIVNDERFAHIPKILETPYDDYKHDALSLYKHNLDVLRSLIV